MAYKQFVYFCGMQIFKIIFDFYLKASVHVALAVVSLAYIGAQSLNIFMSPAVIASLFFGSIVAYNFIKYGVEAKYFIMVSRKSFIPIQILSVIAAIFAVMSLLKLPPISLKLLFVMLLFTSLYALPLGPAKKNLRAIAGLKIYIVAIVWAMATVLMPLSTLGSEELFGNGVTAFNQSELWSVLASVNAGLDTFFWMGVFSLFLAHFVMVLILMIPFEIRDRENDQAGLKTIAQQYGIKKSQKFAYVLIILFLMLQLFNALLFKWRLEHIFLQFLVALFLYISVYKSAKPKSFYFTNFWVESIPILYAICWFYFT